jgi:hypothetical protein
LPSKVQPPAANHCLIFVKAVHVFNIHHDWRKLEAGGRVRTKQDN